MLQQVVSIFNRQDKTKIDTGVFNAACSDLALMCGVGRSWSTGAGIAASAPLNL